MINTSPETPFFLCFPALDPRTVRTGMPRNAPRMPSSAFFLNPGVPDNASPQAWRPDHLPLTKDMVRAFLREAERFAQEHGKAGPGLAGTMHKEDFYTRTSLAIRARLTEAVTLKESARNQAIWAQQVLLLAWQLEQQALEIQALQQAVRKGLDDLARVLGPGEVDEPDDGLFATGELDLPDDDPREMPWRMILEAMLYFTPPWAVLVTGNGEIRAAFEEWPDLSMGTPAETVPAGVWRTIEPLVASGVGRLIHGPGWRLAGRTRCPADKPWLELSRLALLLAPHG